MRKLRYSWRMLLVCLLGAGLPGMLHAQGLDSLYQRALQAHPGLKARKQYHQAALTRAPQVRRLPDPQLGIGSFLLPVETRLGAQHLRLGASQMLPWPGTLPAKAAWADARAEVDYHKIEQLRLELKYQLKAAYLGLYELRQAQLRMEQQLALLDRIKVLVETRVKTGGASLADVLLLEIKRKEMQEEINMLRQREKAPLARLNQVLNRPAAAPVEVKDSLPFAQLPLRKDSLLSSLSRLHPDLKILAAQQKVATRALQVNQKASRPELGLGADYLLIAPRTDASPLNNGRDVIQLKATVSLPLFQDPYRAKAREEELRIQALENEKENTQNALLSQLAQAYATYEEARLFSDLCDQQLMNIQAVMQLMQSEYSNGTRSFEEILRLEGDRIDYELKKLRAIVNSHLALATIERHFLLK